MSRIAILTPYASPVPGGISAYVEGLVNLLRSHGHDVAVMAGMGKGDEDTHSNVGAGFEYLEKCSHLLRRFAPEIVHSHSHWHALAASVRYRRSNPATRLIFSFHTTTAPWWHPRFIQLLRKTDVLTFVSASQLSELRMKLRLSGDLRLLRPATDMLPTSSKLVETWRAEHGLENAYPILAFAGPLEYERKVAGVIDLVASVGTVRAAFPQTRLLILGDGSLRPRVERAIRKLAAPATITGFLQQPQVALSAAHLYCHISYQEGLPIALLEAMASGRCVIASKTGGIPEVINPTNGVLVDRGPETVAAAICSLANDQGRMRSLGERAENTIREAYTWGARFTQVRSIYGMD